jgi:hypothetical protein
MTRLFITATAILGLARALWSVPTVPLRWQLASSLSGGERREPDPLYIARCCFGCGPSPGVLGYISSGGIRYVQDEGETLLAMLPAPTTRAPRVHPGAGRVAFDADLSLPLNRARR